MRKIRWSIAGCAALFAALGAGALADDTVFFSANVPPNVLLFVDESGSMRNIIQHPYFESANAPFVMSNAVTCEVMTLADPANNSFPDFSSPVRTIKLVTGGTTGHRFEPRRSELLDWTATSTALDDPNQGYAERTYCGHTRKIYTDVFMDTYTRTLWPKAYLDWYFHLEPGVVYNHPDPAVSETKTGAEILAEIESPTNGRNYITGDYYPQYQISRMWAAKIVAKEVMYRTNTDCPAFLGDCGDYKDRVRFGIAVFRSGNHGGFVSSPAASYATDKAALETAVDNLITRTSTPLGETLFQLYTYFMKRGDGAGDDADRPSGLDGTAFPNYAYMADGTHSSMASDWAPDPIVWDCQKNFIIMITDGAPSHDQFTTSGSVTQRFDKFHAMVGDYAPDLVTEDDWNQAAPAWTIADPSKEEGTPPWPQSHNAGYLDDIALFMKDHDLRGDIAGTQAVDVYTVGFTTIGAVNTLLFKTARNGNGEFFAANQADELAFSVSEAIRDIIEKTQAFTSATVPASRTTQGDNFYTSFFRPLDGHPFWEGHLRNYEFTQGGEVLTSDGKCALGSDPTAVPPCPVGGTLRSDALPFWDAAEQVPVPALRNLHFGRGDTAIFGSPPDWDTATVTQTDLGLAAGDLSLPPYDGASDLTDLTGKIVDNISGCVFGTSCVTRVTSTGDKALLGDIFHSNPIAVGSPNAAINDSSYVTFANNHRTRRRMIYAGSNDGFLHALNAGDWQTLEADGITPLVPPRHDRGTGAEVFAFMPSEIRSTIKQLRVDTAATRSYYAVDGSPVVADVWFHRDFTSTPPTLSPALTQADKLPEQWRTVLMGGLRQGGRSYYALDVTDPATPPGYLWDFPCDPAHCGSAVNSNSASWTSYMGETWSEPVITRVRVSGNTPGAYERWVAIFGGGYSAAGDPNDPGYEHAMDGTADPAGRAIFMVDVTTGEVLAVKYFSHNAVSAGGQQIGFPEMRYAIASSPAVFDLDFDGFADVIYIGDLGGNLWKWVVDSVGDDPINTVSGELSQPSWDFRLFFRGAAETEPPTFPAGGSHFQSFFAPPTGVKRGGELRLAWGAGERADPIGDAADYNDGSAADNNHFYVVKDKDPREHTIPAPDPLLDHLDESDLADNTALNSISCADLKNNHSGFFLTGRDAEKFFSRSVIFLGKLITTSYIPPDPAQLASDPCTDTGTAFLYFFDVDCGGGGYPSNPGGADEERRKAIGGGIPASRPRVSVGGINSGASGGSGPCANRVVVVTSDGGIQNDCAEPLPSSGINVRNWRER